MNTSLSIFARALASENVTFTFDANAETASFDVKARHLVMPVWDVSDTLRTMLVAHEIAHALWTPYEQSDKLFKEAEAQGMSGELLHRICNMIEDVRIEKLMKAKYPGTRRDFFLGYREIVDKGMFNLNTLDWSKADMIGRLNGHFKWGAPGFLTIPMNDEEWAIAAEVDAVETFAEAFDLAKRLYQHPSMERQRKHFEQMAQTQSSGSKGDGKGEKGEGESSDVFGDCNDLTNMGGAFARKDGNAYHVSNVTISPVARIQDAIIPTSYVMQRYDKAYGVYGVGVNVDKYRTYVRESDAFVRQLVAQFERKKAADEIRRERPKQTGMLNLDRLHQYRTHDDIFLSKIIKQDGKNHGIMFLIDFSGSMGQTIGNCVHQVMQLVWFCEKAKIPFQVYGFTGLASWANEGVYDREQKEYLRNNPQDPYGTNFRCASLELSPANPRPTSVAYGDTRLVCLASSDDSAADRERLLAYLYETYCAEGRGASVIPFGGTPTVESVALISQVMREWVSAKKIQIPTLMIVTDGQPNGINTMDGNYNGAYINENTTLCVQNEIFGSVTQVDHSLNGIDIPNAAIGTMLNDLRTNLNARCIGMYVANGRTLSDSYFRSFCITRKEYGDSRKQHYAYDSYDKSPRYDACNKAFVDGAMVLPKSIFPGYDSYFIIRSMKAVSDDDAIVDSASFVKVKNTFIKTMGKRSSSRVFLSKYVDIVAGVAIREEDDPIYRLPFGFTYEGFRQHLAEKRKK